MLSSALPPRPRPGTGLILQEEQITANTVKDLPLFPPSRPRNDRHHTSSSSQLPATSTGTSSDTKGQRRNRNCCRPGDVLIVTLPVSGDMIVNDSSTQAAKSKQYGGIEACICIASASSSSFGSSLSQFREPNDLNSSGSSVFAFDSSTFINLSTAELTNNIKLGRWKRIFRINEELKTDYVYKGNESDGTNRSNIDMCKCFRVSQADESIDFKTTDDSSDLSRGGVYRVEENSDNRISRLRSLTLQICNTNNPWRNPSEQPLITTWIKRSMLGKMVPNGSVTTLQLPVTVERNQSGERLERSVRLRAILAQGNELYGAKNGNDCCPIFLVTPSTRITVSAAEIPMKPVQPSGRDPKLHLSKAARMLIDIIRAVRRMSMALAAADDAPGDARRFVTRSILLSGPPGVGKTYAVKQACFSSPDESSSATQLFSLRGSDLLTNNSSTGGASAMLERIFVAAAEYASKDTKNVSIVFLDECDALMASDACVAMLACLLDRMDGSPGASSKGLDKREDGGWFKIILVAATNRLDVIPPFLRRPGRLDRELCVSPPSATERKVILESLIESCQEEFVDVQIDEEELSAIADVCVGYVAADLSSLIRKASLLSLEDFGHQEYSAGNRRQFSVHHLRRAMLDVCASALRDASLSAPPKATWDDIAGDPGGAKTQLRQAIEWPKTKRKDFERLGLTAPRGVLLHGPPGCAKTSLARAAAGSAGVAFFSLSPADVFASSYVGEAEAIVRRAFSVARSAAPCILFFDEVDAILGDGGTDDKSSLGMGRSGTGSSAEARVLSTFLNEMDGIDGSIQDGVLVLGATNRPGTLDAALLRPGRFDKLIYVPSPDKAARKAIILKHCKQWSRAQNLFPRSPTCADTSPTVIDADYLSSDEITGGFTGAEIVGACREAAMFAIREVTDRHISEKEKVGDHVEIACVAQEHLLKAIKEVKPLLHDNAIASQYDNFG